MPSKALSNPLHRCRYCRRIKFAADEGADVINMSWAVAVESHLIKDVQSSDYAIKKGVVIIG